MAEATRDEETEEQFASEEEGGEEESVAQLHAGDTGAICFNMRGACS